MTDRILLGKNAANNFGLWISRPGADVTATGINWGYQAEFEDADTIGWGVPATATLPASAHGGELNIDDIENLLTFREDYADPYIEGPSITVPPNADTGFETKFDGSKYPILEMNVRNVLWGSPADDQRQASCEFSIEDYDYGYLNTWDPSITVTKLRLNDDDWHLRHGGEIDEETKAPSNPTGLVPDLWKVGDKIRIYFSNPSFNSVYSYFADLNGLTNHENKNYLEVKYMLDVNETNSFFVNDVVVAGYETLGMWKDYLSVGDLIVNMSRRYPKILSLDTADNSSDRIDFWYNHTFDETPTTHSSDYKLTLGTLDTIPKGAFNEWTTLEWDFRPEKLPTVIAEVSITAAVKKNPAVYPTAADENQSFFAIAPSSHITQGWNVGEDIIIVEYESGLQSAEVILDFIYLYPKFWADSIWNNQDDDDGSWYLDQDDNPCGCISSTGSSLDGHFITSTSSKIIIQLRSLTGGPGRLQPTNIGQIFWGHPVRLINKSLLQRTNTPSAEYGGKSHKGLQAHRWATPHLSVAGEGKLRLSIDIDDLITTEAENTTIAGLKIQFNKERFTDTKWEIASIRAKEAGVSTGIEPFPGSWRSLSFAVGGAGTGGIEPQEMGLIHQTGVVKIGTDGTVTEAPGGRPDFHKQWVGGFEQNVRIVDYAGDSFGHNGWSMHLQTVFADETGDKSNTWIKVVGQTAHNTFHDDMFTYSPGLIRPVVWVENLSIKGKPRYIAPPATDGLMVDAYKEIQQLESGDIEWGVFILDVSNEYEFDATGATGGLPDEWNEDNGRSLTTGDWPLDWAAVPSGVVNIDPPLPYIPFIIFQRYDPATGDSIETPKTAYPANLLDVSYSASMGADDLGFTEYKSTHADPTLPSGEMLKSFSYALQRLTGPFYHTPQKLDRWSRENSDKRTEYADIMSFRLPFEGEYATIDPRDAFGDGPGGMSVPAISGYHGSHADHYLQHSTGQDSTRSPGGRRTWSKNYAPGDSNFPVPWTLGELWNQDHTVDFWDPFTGNGNKISIDDQHSLWPPSPYHPGMSMLRSANGTFTAGDGRSGLLDAFHISFDYLDSYGSQPNTTSHYFSSVSTYSKEIPFVYVSSRYGGGQSFHAPHVTPWSQVGSNYNVDNSKLETPNVWNVFSRYRVGPGNGEFVDAEAPNDGPSYFALWGDLGYEGKLDFNESSTKSSQDGVPHQSKICITPALIHKWMVMETLKIRTFAYIRAGKDRFEITSRGALGQEGHEQASHGTYERPRREKFTTNGVFEQTPVGIASKYRVVKNSSANAIPAGMPATTDTYWFFDAQADAAQLNEPGTAVGETLIIGREPDPSTLKYMWDQKDHTANGVLPPSIYTAEHITDFNYYHDADAYLWQGVDGLGDPYVSTGSFPWTLGQRSFVNFITNRGCTRNNYDMIYDEFAAGNLSAEWELPGTLGPDNAYGVRHEFIPGLAAGGYSGFSKNGRPPWEWGGAPCWSAPMASTEFNEHMAFMFNNDDWNLYESTTNFYSDVANVYFDDTTTTGWDEPRLEEDLIYGTLNFYGQNTIQGPFPGNLKLHQFYGPTPDGYDFKELYNLGNVPDPADPWGSFRKVAPVEAANSAHLDSYGTDGTNYPGESIFSLGTIHNFRTFETGQTLNNIRWGYYDKDNNNSGDGNYVAPGNKVVDYDMRGLYSYPPVYVSATQTDAGAIDARYSSEPTGLGNPVDESLTRFPFTSHKYWHKTGDSGWQGGYPLDNEFNSSDNDRNKLGYGEYWDPSSPDYGMQVGVYPQPNHVPSLSTKTNTNKTFIAMYESLINRVESRMSSTQTPPISILDDYNFVIGLLDNVHFDYGTKKHHHWLHPTFGQGNIAGHAVHDGSIFTGGTGNQTVSGDYIEHNIPSSGWLLEHGTHIMGYRNITSALNNAPRVRYGVSDRAYIDWGTMFYYYDIGMGELQPRRDIFPETHDYNNRNTSARENQHDSYFDLLRSVYGAHHKHGPSTFYELNAGVATPDLKYSTGYGSQATYWPPGGIVHGSYDDSYTGVTPTVYGGYLSQVPLMPGAGVDFMYKTSDAEGTSDIPSYNVTTHYEKASLLLEAADGSLSGSGLYPATDYPIPTNGGPQENEDGSVYYAPVGGLKTHFATTNLPENVAKWEGYTNVRATEGILHPRGVSQYANNSVWDADTNQTKDLVENNQVYYRYYVLRIPANAGAVGGIDI